MPLGLGIDTGGTYTDAVVTDLDTDEVLARGKAPTTRDDLVRGIREALGLLDPELVGKVSLVSLSSTLATNSVVEGKGCRAGLVCIGKRYEVFPHPDAYAFIDGSFSMRGEEETPLDESALEVALNRMNGKIDSLAISGYLSVRNPSHEMRAAEIARRVLNIPVVCAHTLTSKLGFDQRATTALMNARLIPVVQDLITSVRNVMDELNMEAPLMIVKGDGSLMRYDDAVRRPVETILSGPASSITGATTLTKLKDAVVIDMGGTTSDVGVLRNGVPRVCSEGALIGGRRTRVTAVDVSTFGIGGDSRIVVNGRDVFLSAVRVIPLCVASRRWTSVKEKIRSLSSVTDDRAAEDKPLEKIVQDTEFFTLAHSGTEAVLTEIESRFMSLISRGPVRVREAAQILQVNPNAVPVARLESLGFVTRIGFTPTDVLHAEGLYTEHDAEVSVTAADYLARRCRVSTDVFLRRVHQLVTEKIAGGVMGKVITDETGRDELDTSEQAMVAACLSPGPDGYSVRFTLKHPLIGLGAPARAWLPDVADVLGTELVTPSDYEMGNAIGAISGSVSETVEVTVRAVGDELITDPECMVYTRNGSKRLLDPERALEFAKTTAIKEATEAALRAGAVNPVVDVETEESTMNINSESCCFRGATVRAIATGKPDCKTVR